MIRTSKHILKFANQNKLGLLEYMYQDFHKCVELYIDLIVTDQLPLKKLISCTQLPDTIFINAKWKEAAYKNASEIIRTSLKYIKDKTFKRYQKLYAECKKNNIHHNFTNKRFSELNINYLKRVKINIKSISISLKSDLWNSLSGESFNEFIKISTPYRNYSTKNRYYKINIPIKHHRQSNKFKDWIRKNTIQLSKTNGNFYITFFYEKEDYSIKQHGESIGLDCGYKKLLSDSNGNHYGQELEQIYIKLANKKKNSKNYKQLLKYKKNLTNRIVNSINFNPYNLVVVEDLKNVKHKSKLSKKFNNKLQYWSYKQVLDKLAIRSEEEGFYLLSVNPAYTSQTCSLCGVVDKNNRNGEIYQCTSCGLLIDADTNGAMNILSRGTCSSSSIESKY